MKYIFAISDFKNSMFSFEKDRKYEVLSEEPDAYVFMNDKGHADQISKSYLMYHQQICIIEE